MCPPFFDVDRAVAYPSVLSVDKYILILWDPSRSADPPWLYPGRSRRLAGRNSCGTVTLMSGKTPLPFLATGADPVAFRAVSLCRASLPPRALPLPAFNPQWTTCPSFLLPSSSLLVTPFAGQDRAFRDPPSLISLSASESRLGAATDVPSALSDRRNRRSARPDGCISVDLPLAHSLPFCHDTTPFFILFGGESVAALHALRSSHG